MDGCDFAQEGESPATAGAGVCFGLGKFGFRFGIDAEVKADGLQGAACCGAHEAVVTHSCKAFG